MQKSEGQVVQKVVQEVDPVETERPLAFYFLMIFLFFGTSFIGYNFGHIIGACFGFLFALLVNIYALRIKLD